MKSYYKILFGLSTLFFFVTSGSLNAQCSLDGLSSDSGSVPFSTSGGTQNITITWSNTQPGACTGTITFSGVPDWINVDHYQYNIIRVQCDPGTSKEALFQYSYSNGGSGGIYVTRGTPSTYYRDFDQDNYGDANNTKLSYGQPSGYVTNSSDCVDSNPNIHPGATEINDGVDNDCDGQVDENTVTIGKPTGDAVQYRCGPGTKTLVATPGSNGNGVRWYDVPSTGGTPLSENNNFQVNLTTTKTYWVSTFNQSTQFESSELLEVTAEVRPIPNEPVVNVNPSCGPGTVTLTASGTSGATYRWYDASGNYLESGTSFSRSLSTSQNYQVAARLNGCEGSKTTVTAVVLTPPVAPTVNVNPSCGPGTVTLTASGTSGATYRWYDASGNYLESGTTFSRSLSTSQNYQVAARLNGCEGSKTTVTAVVLTPPVAPTVNVIPSCGPGVVSMTASGISGATYKWYNASGTYIASGANYSPSLSQSGNYQVSAEVNGCEGPKLTVTAGVKTVPEDPALEIGSQPACSVATGTFTITNYNSAYTYVISPSTGVTRIGDTVTAPPGTYSVTATLEECTSGTSDNMTINAQPSPQTWYSDVGDGDGLGDPGDTLVQCEQPSGYVSNSSDNCPLIDDPSNACEVHSSNPQDHNYIYSRTYQQESTTMIDPLRFVQNDILIQQITFFDGLGRPSQQLGLGQTPKDNNGDTFDVVTHVGYDDFGRQEKEWLPYADKDLSTALGSFRTEADSDVDIYYESNYGQDILSGSPNPFSQKELEPSPLSRVLKQAAPGKDWQLSIAGDDHTIGFEYLVNDTLEVKQYNVSLGFADKTYVPTLTDNGHYLPGELYKTITYDENHPGTATKNYTTEEFKDKQGRVVLKRTYADMDTTDDGDTNDPEDAEIPHDTYYVYDDYGNLTYVLPPKMDATTETLANINSGLDGLGYQYVYDHRNRLVEKKIPGKEWEHIVYNKLDQPIMTQDSIQRANNEWLFTKYDALGRVAYTGKVTDGRAREVIQTNSVDVLTADLWVKQGNSYPFGSIDVNYDNGAYPTANITEILTINYYDDHDFDRANEPTPPTQVFSANVDNRTKGLATGSKVKVLGENHWITTVTRYDAKGRPIYTYSENSFLGTVDIVKTKLDFVGKPVKVHTSHTRNGSTIATLDNFEYDHVGRLLKQTQCIGNQNLGYDCSGSIVEPNPIIENETVDYNIAAPNSITLKPVTIISGTPSGLTFSIDPSVSGTGGEEELIARNEYDELGQLVRKKVGNTEASPLQTVDYTYNIRGWLTGINDISDTTPDKLFNFGITYNGGTKPLYNGNISRTQWRTDNQDSSLKSYDYTYDALNRITDAVDNTGKYNLTGVTYDKNGNIGTLQRQGWTSTSPSLANNTGLGIMDDLDYEYYANSNRLLSVQELHGASATYGFNDGAVQSTEYDYDVNGNMTQDLNKGITSILYNHLNLPTNIVTDSGNISYVYDATGTKLRKTVSGGGSVTDYAGNFVYSNSGAGPNFEFFSHPEGYVASDGMGGYDYVYQYKDHLGNIRLSYLDANQNNANPVSLEIVEENNYYPFGLKHKGYNDSGMSPLGNDVAQKWKFGGKEYDDSFGLEMYDFGARNYDPALGRWGVIDALAEDPNQIDKSPYAYAWNNPVYYTDPDGNCPICVVVVFLLAAEVSNAPTGNPADGKAIEYAKNLQANTLMIGAGGAGTNGVRGFVKEVAKDAIADATGVPMVNPKVLKDIKNLNIDQKALKRGKDSETRVLKEEGITKNTTKYSATDPKTGKLENTIPDGMENAVTEIKDTKVVYDTKQIRVQREVAKSQDMEHKIITGTNTKVSQTVMEKSKVIRRDDLGPQNKGK
ncbi:MULTISPECIES: DUF6443 domain-containing protein [Flavobacteriaceae]|uniref:Ig-like domain-containing protein n=1 Tax=Flavobacteriaceae TaxID=49546 RepID=UPI00234B2099|nr:DUF6443 domain-containing protein [Muricauda sp. SP22]MDC6364023.1 DUF6443 domain-containing protein [Muricauda sp. SP22]